MDEPEGVVGPGAVAAVAGEEVPTRLPLVLPLPATAIEVAQFIALRAAACVGADYANFALLNPAGASLRLFHGPFLDSAIADRYTDVAIDAPYPIAAAVRSATAIVLPDLEAYRERFPEILPDTIAAGVQATASLPLYRSDGSLVGAIGFAWSEPPSFDLRLQTALEAVALLCTDNIERARQYEEEHQLIVELHRSMFDDLPQSAGLAIAARYISARDSGPVGGDWYEGLKLADDRIAFVVGDVAGHGITAAADMALLRGMITALLHSGVAVSDVFGEVSRILGRRTGMLLATAALVVVDTADDTLTFATAGHPPPVVLDSDGQVRFLDTANAPMIGLDATRAVADTVPFPPASQLIVFTDGLVERHDRSFDLGIEEMAIHLGELRQHVGPVELIDSLVHALVDDVRATDDIAILVVENL